MVSQTSPFTRNVKWFGYKDESDLYYSNRWLDIGQVLILD